MKIKINSFYDRARFVPSILFKQMKKRRGRPVLAWYFFETQARLENGQAARNLLKS